MSKIKGISLPESLWSQIDTARQDVSRSVFVRRAIETRLQEVKKNQKRTLGSKGFEATTTQQSIALGVDPNG